MSPELSDGPTETRSRTTTRSRPPAVPATALDELRARLRAVQHLRPGQLAVLATLLAVVALVAGTPAALTGFLGLFTATVALLVVAPYAVVRLATDVGR